jgi:hypothetical protein
MRRTLVFINAPIGWLISWVQKCTYSYFLLDEYSGKDDFSRYWRDEWVSGLTSWRKALKIPDSDVVIEGRSMCKSC